MTMRLKSVLAAGVLASAVMLKATASDLYGGGAPFPMRPYTGVVGAQTTPANIAPNSIFGTFMTLAGDNMWYCPTTSDFGRLVQVGTLSAALPCPPGFGTPFSQTLPNYIGANFPYTAVAYSDFLASSVAPTKTAIVQIPTLVGAIALPFRHAGVTGNIALSLTDICNIFGGVYTNWSQVGLPAKPITWVFRSDNNETTVNFSLSIAANCNQIAGGPIPPSGGAATLTTNQNHVATGMPASPGAGVGGNFQMVVTVSAIDGAIGYAEMDYLVGSGVSYIYVDGWDPMFFTSPRFTASDLLVDRVIISALDVTTGVPATAPLSVLPGATTLSALLMIDPTKTAGSGYPIFAATYIATYARGNADADAGGDFSAYLRLRQLQACITDPFLNCRPPTLPPGFDYVDLDPAALAMVNAAIFEIQN